MKFARFHPIHLGLSAESQYHLDCPPINCLETWLLPLPYLLAIDFEDDANSQLAAHDFVLSTELLLQQEAF